jgi:hypothetical protein
VAKVEPANVVRTRVVRVDLVHTKVARVVHARTRAVRVDLVHTKVARVVHVRTREDPVVLVPADLR